MVFVASHIRSSIRFLVSHKILLETSALSLSVWVAEGVDAYNRFVATNRFAGVAVRCLYVISQHGFTLEAELAKHFLSSLLLQRHTRGQHS